MTKLVIRKIPWEFDDTVPFLWQPAHPNFSMFCNVFTFIAVPFEKYIIAALRQAQDHLARDPGSRRKRKPSSDKKLSTLRRTASTCRL